MNSKTLFIVFLLLLGIFSSCGSTKPGKTAASVEEAESIIAKERKKKGRIAKKQKRAAEKHYWSLQSKEAKKSIKRNKRRHKREKRGAIHP
jgi:hypothetical protein